MSSCSSVSRRLEASTILIFKYRGACFKSRSLYAEIKRSNSSRTKINLKNLFKRFDKSSPVWLLISVWRGSRAYYVGLGHRELAPTREPNVLDATLGDSSLLCISVRILNLFLSSSSFLSILERNKWTIQPGFITKSLDLQWNRTHWLKTAHFLLRILNLSRSSFVWLSMRALTYSDRNFLFHL